MLRWIMENMDRPGSGVALKKTTNIVAVQHQRTTEENRIQTNVIGLQCPRQQWKMETGSPQSQLEQEFERQLAEMTIDQSNNETQNHEAAHWKWCCKPSTVDSISHGKGQWLWQSISTKQHNKIFCIRSATRRSDKFPWLLSNDIMSFLWWQNHCRAWGPLSNACCATLEQVHKVNSKTEIVFQNHVNPRNKQCQWGKQIENAMQQVPTSWMAKSLFGKEWKQDWLGATLWTPTKRWWELQNEKEKR